MEKQVAFNAEALGEFTKEELNSILTGMGPDGHAGYTAKALKKMPKDDLIAEIIEVQEKKAATDFGRKQAAANRNKKRGFASAGSLKIARDMMREDFVSIEEMVKATVDAYPTRVAKSVNVHLSHAIPGIYRKFGFEIEVKDEEGQPRRFKITSEPPTPSESDSPSDES